MDNPIMIVSHRSARRTRTRTAVPRVSTQPSRRRRHFAALVAVLAGVPLLLSLLRAEQTGAARRVLGGDDSTRRLAIVAPDGSLEWELAVTAIHDAWLLPNGHVLAQQGWQRVVEVDKDKKTVWEYDAGKMNGNDGKRVEVHAFQ